MSKIAIFVSGPYRHCNYVVSQVSKIINSDHEFDFFIHLWESDSSLKTRSATGTYFDLESNRRVKKLIVEQPLIEDEVIERIRDKGLNFSYDKDCYIGHSPINNVIGMFYGINKLYRYLDENNLMKDYSHVLRLRTDISIIKKNVIPKEIDNDVVYVSYNPLVEDYKVSDHSMLMGINDFEKIWLMNDDFYNTIMKSKYNPEIYLGNVFNKNKIKTKTLLKRFSEYNVIYEEPKPFDPKFIINRNDIHDVYLKPVPFLLKLEANYRYYRTLIVKSRLYRKLRGFDD